MNKNNIYCPQCGEEIINNLYNCDCYKGKRFSYSLQWCNICNSWTQRRGVKIGNQCYSCKIKQQTVKFGSNLAKWHKNHPEESKLHNGKNGKKCLERLWKNEEWAKNRLNILKETGGTWYEEKYCEECDSIQQFFYGKYCRNHQKENCGNVDGFESSFIFKEDILYLYNKINKKYIPWKEYKENFNENHGGNKIMAEKRLALTKDGQITYCTAAEENIGKGRCNHVEHQRPGETGIEFKARSNKIFTNSHKTIENEKYLEEKICTVIISPWANEKDVRDFINSIDCDIEVTFKCVQGFRVIKAKNGNENIDLLKLLKDNNFERNYTFVEDNDGTSVDYFIDDSYDPVTDNIRSNHLLPGCEKINGKLMLVNDKKVPFIFGCFNPA